MDEEIERKAERNGQRSHKGHQLLSKALARLGIE